MNLRIIITVIIGIIAFIILFRREKVYKYLNKSGRIIFLFLIIAIIVICSGFIGTQIYRNGLGALLTDYADSKTSDKGSGTPDDVLIITISLDSITIEDSIYDNVLDVQQIIADAVNSGKHLRVIDDYALAKTYNDLIDVILKMKVSRSNIEEIQQP